MKNKKQDLDGIYKIFVEWKARPRIKITNDMTTADVEAIEALNIPQNHIEFMEKYNISEENVREFVGRDEYVTDLRNAVIMYGKTQLVELIHSALDKAKQSNKVSDIETVVDMIENLKKRVIDNPDETALFERLTDEDYNRILERETNNRIADGI